MTRILIALFAVFGTCFLFSCSADESTSTEETTNEAPAAAESAGEDNSQSENVVENLPWTFLVNGIFHNNMTIKAGEGIGENPNEGYWVDFKDNGTFAYGKYDETLYEGEWYFDADSYLLELIPKSGTGSRSEWTVKHKENTLIWVGTSKYGNNATQMQWLRREGYPTQ